MVATRFAPTRSDSQAEALGGVTLVHGSEDLLADRAVEAIVSAVHTVDPEADRTEVDASELNQAVLAELTSPSLFASSRVVVVRGMDALPAEMGDVVLAYAKAPAPDVAVALVHRGGQKGRGMLDKLRKVCGATVSCESPKPYELPKFVAAEVSRAGGRIDEKAASLLVDAVGSDLRALSAATMQLLSDTGGEPLTETLVRRYFAGRAEVSGFAVADAALAGEAAYALEQLRWALRTGVAPVLLTSALASGLRNLARLAGADRSLRDADLAREVGVPAWKLKTLRRQLGGWNSAGLAAAIQTAAQADADVKGAAGDPGYALEKAVLTVAESRDR